LNYSPYDVISGVHKLSIGSAGYAAGKVGGAASLSGSRSVALATAHPDFDLGTSSAGFTLEFWINSGSPAPAIGWVNGANFYLFDGNRLAGNFREANGTNHTFDSNTWGGFDTIWITAGTWNQVVITYDRPSGVARFFQNGILRHTENYGSFAIASSGDFRLGGTGFVGLFDEVSLYRRPLAVAEVASLFAVGANGKSTPDNNAPPVVSAGPDLLVPDAAIPVNLVGVVQEDDRPFGLPTITWMKVEGPGTVVFGNAAAKETTATFGVSGAYLLKLTADDHYATPVSDLVEVRVGGGFQEPSSGLAAWWPGNGAPAEVVRGHNVELINGAGYASSQVLSGFQFLGNGGYGIVPRHADLDIGASPQGFTIEFWINSASSATFLSWAGGVSFYLFDGNRFAGNLREANGTSHNFDTYTLGGEVMWTTQPPWHHIAVTYDRPSGLIRMYQNGRLMQSVNYGSFALGTTGDLLLGSAGFTGMLDELSLYTRPLSLNEIAAIHAAGARGKSLPDDNSPPTVSAGADVLVPATTASAALSAVVTDDNRPFGTPVVNWTKVDGPGTVVFGQPNAKDTSATFSAPGTYLLQLTASDRATQPVSDIVEVRVGAGYVEPAPGIAAWWPGNGEPHEIINGNHDVEFFNGAGYAAARVSQGFRFVGTGGYGRVPQHADFNVGTSAQGFTIEFWVNSSSNATFLSWANGASFYLFDGNRFAGNLREANGTNHSFDTYTLGGEVMWTTETPWNHVAVTYDRPTGLVRMYQNGRLKQSVNYGSFALATNGDFIFGSGGFSGSLDEVTLYRRPLAPAEIAAIHQSGTLGKSAPDNNTPPTVSAGPDVVVAAAGGSAVLNGNVTDDQRPFGPPAVAWIKLEGPGDVAFAAANAMQTTATFSAAGLYVLQLTASDGYSPPVSDVVEVRVGGGAAALPPAAAVWWPGNNSPQEVIVGGHDVELINGAGYASGKVAQAFRFLGSADYGRVTRHADLDIGSSAAGYSIEFWLNSTSNKTFLAWSGGASFYLVDGNRLGGNLREANGANHSFDSYSLGGSPMWTYLKPWNHIVVTYDRTTGNVRMYQDGVLMQNVNFGSYALATAGDLFFGGGSFSGLLDETTLYRRPLTAAEVSSIYNAGVLGKQPQVNLTPVASAGPDQSTLLGTPITLAGSATDDGLPASPGSLTYLWSKVSGPGDVTFGSAAGATTTAAFSAPGNYVLRFSASDSLLVGTDDVIVTVAAPPVVAITAPANNSTLAANTAFTLVATATDADGTVTKVEFFRDGNLLGEDTTSPYTFAVSAGLAAGSYEFTAKATDNAGNTASSAPVNVTVVADPGPPVASISTPVEDARLSAPTAISGVIASPLLSTWSLEYRLKAPEGQAPAAWMRLATGTSSVGTPAAGATPATPGPLGIFDPTLLINGIYELRLTATDTAGRIVVDGPITVVVEGNMKIGAFSLAFEDLRVPVAGIPITLTRTYDSRDIRPGDFGPGWLLALANIRVQKNTNLGLGWTQDKEGDELSTIYFLNPLRQHLVTIVMPDGETHRFEASIFVPRTSGPIVPDNAKWVVPIQSASLVFKPVGDTTSTLLPEGDNVVLFTGRTGEVVLTQDDPNDLEPVVYNPTRFRLTTKDGTVFLLDEALGLLEMRDLNGNTLVLNRDGQNRVVGVTSTQNAGSPVVTSVTIHRDATGRVDYIRDPAGHDLDYLYDAQGRLSSFTNRESNTAQFRYENVSFPYYLTKIIDPRGVAAIRTEFDASGRMIKQIDAEGSETIFNRGIDSTGRFEKVKDRLGNETTFYYDDRGNVTLKIDPLGAQTSYSYYPDGDRVKFEADHYGNVKSFVYDARGNVLVETIGASVIEDPANPTTGHTTRTAYNAQGSPTEMVDPDGRKQAFTYSSTTGNLLTHTAGVGGIAPSTSTYTYYTDGTLKTIVDALGNITTQSYDYAFNDPTYPGAVKKTTMTLTDPAGLAGSDPANTSATVMRTSVTLVDAQENQLAQIANRHLPDGTAEDVVTRYVYDTENRLVATIMPDGRVTETRYTSFGKEEKSVLWKSVADYQARDDARARITSYGYDNRGNQTSVTYADGTTEVMHFDLENRKDWSQDRRGFRMFFVYDAVGRLRFTIFPDADDQSGPGGPPVGSSDSRLANNPRTETAYDLAGRVTDTYDELRHRTTIAYFPDGTADASRRKQAISVRSLGNLVTSYQYDAAGNVRYVTDPRGNTVETRYDDQGRPTTVVYPATDEHPVTQSVTHYDLLGRRIEAIDQEGKVTRYRYDALGRLIEVRQYIDAAAAPGDADFSLSSSDARIAITRYTYDELGNQQTQTDALGRTTTFWTDNLGRRTKRLLPKDAAESTALSETLQYDEWGNLWKRTDFAGKTTTFGYDTLSRLKSKTADATHPSLAYSHAIARVEYDYDVDGTRTAARTYNASDVQLYTESTPHDERGRLDYKDTTGGRLDYSYYANSLLKDTVSSNSGGLNVGYRYDEVNRLEAVDDTSTGLPTRTTGYTYNANGSLETLTQPDAVVHTYDYDALNRLRGLVVSRGTTLLHTYEYKLNPSGHRRQVIENSTRTTTYGHDDLYRLKSETIAGDTNGQNGDLSYDLDQVGNRKSRTSSMASVLSALNQSYDSRDWLNGDTYDANGNTITGQLADLAARGNDLYDFENRLILRTKADGSSINLSYDAAGNRIAKNILNSSGQLVSSTAWLVDTNNHTGSAQVVEERSQIANPASQISRTYTYGTQLLSQATSFNSQPAIVSYYAFDGHGNVRELTDSSGPVTDRYDYDAFGNLVFQSGTTANAYRYSGEQYDADLGLYYNRARYLNTDSGRFWSMDSYGGNAQDPASLHKYLYAHGNPVNGTDPSGRWNLSEVMITTTVVGTLGGMAGAAIGGIDSSLGGGSFWEGAATGAKWGAGLSVMSLVPGLGPVILTGGAFMGGYGIGSAINEGQYAQAAFRVATVAGSFALAGYKGKTPLGFQDQGEFFKFGAALSRGLKRAGYEDTRAYMRGSSVTGSGRKGPFDDGRISDYDVALVGDAIFARAKALGLVDESYANGTRTWPLKEQSLQQMGLSSLAAELSAAQGRPVSLMIYQEAGLVAARGDYIVIQ
jgi:RHS repeat-associated protein